MDTGECVARSLRGLLCSQGLGAGPPGEIGGGRARLDVSDGPGLIAVVCGPDGEGGRARAVAGAAEALAPAGRADAALAVAYPPECRGAGLQAGTQVSACIVDRYVAGSAARARWSECAAGGLAGRIRNMRGEIGDPGTIAARLCDAVDAAAGCLSEGERKALGESLGLGPRRGRWRPAARRALLAVASASVFHARLDAHLGAAAGPRIDARAGAAPPSARAPESLESCCRAACTPSRLSAAWSTILDADRKPIFESGVRALGALRSAAFTRAVRAVAEWSLYAAGQAGGTRHDIVGRVFHAVLEDAQFDGSFYTSAPAAALLAGLALPDAPPPGRLASFRVVDPACGTGTLLMAVAERLRGAPGGGAHLVEDVLVGLDINGAALDTAAATLGLLSPATRFGDMGLHRMPFGGAEGAAGSLELCAPGAPPPRGCERPADLVIMNPPYTRNDKRHDQLGGEAEARVKRRESEILAASPVRLDMTSSGLMFLVLAERLCSDSGTLACVFPLSAATAPSARGVRRFLAERFDIEYLVASHDPRREYFSENTAIAEMLLVLRRRAGGGAARGSRRPAVVTLLENPSTAGEAAALAAGIAAGRPGPRAVIDRMQPGQAAAGDWGRVLFASPLLHRAHADIREGRLFEAVRLGDVADVRCGRDVRGCFDASRTPGGVARASMYGHDTSRVVTVECRPYAYLVPKEGMAGRAEAVWSRASHLLFPEKLRLNLAHVTAVCSPDETVGTSWYAVRSRSGGAADRLRWSKAMAVFLNSTPGIVAALGMRVPTVLSRPRFASAGARGVPVPRLGAGQIGALVEAYDAYAARPIGRFAEPGDPVRGGIDGAVSRLLGIDGGAVARMRAELAREPMCTGRRYGQ